MNPRAVLLVLALLGAVFIAYLLMLREASEPVVEEQQFPSFPVDKKEEAPSAPDMPTSDTTSRAFSFFDAGDTVEDEKKPQLLRHYGAQRRSATDDLRLVQGVLEQFWRMTRDPDQLRLGSNEDIMRGLTGVNSVGVEFVSPDNEFLNTKGELLDRWGEPLFFHANSVTDIEVRSSGPDRDRFTDDDIVARARTTSRVKQ